ncbi:MAG: tetratricopeptide repeat protein [Flavobacteriales bacterium]|nr:tetratricopeptide repeat protein [Flavobacteriales bacterium]NUQ16401.1 tetratricopeptide repeat protein [Flavobacteriales bacterium]
MRSFLLATALLLAAAVQGQQADDVFADGLAAIRQQEHRTAVDIFTGVIAQRPAQAKAWYYRGLSREALGDRTGALHDLDRALLLEPADLNIRLRRAETLVHAERYREAEADLQAILEAAPGQAIALHARYTRGQVLVAQGDREGALAVYDELVRLAPGDAKAWCNRGLVRNGLGEHEAAVADLAHALSLDPTLVKAYGGRAQALIALGRAQEACADIVKARELGDAGLDELLIIYCL